MTWEVGPDVAAVMRTEPLLQVLLTVWSGLVKLLKLVSSQQPSGCRPLLSKFKTRTKQLQKKAKCR